MLETTWPAPVQVVRTLDSYVLKSSLDILRFMFTTFLLAKTCKTAEDVCFIHKHTYKVKVLVLSILRIQKMYQHIFFQLKWAVRGAVILFTFVVLLSYIITWGFTLYCSSYQQKINTASHLFHTRFLSIFAFLSL